MFTSKGFTLLELIVVILIIGILGSLGFTQYTVALERSRTAEGIQVLGAIRQAQLGYYLEHSSYADNLTLLGYFPDVAVYLASLKYFTGNVRVMNGSAANNGAIGRVRRAALSSNNPFGSYCLDINTNGTITCCDSDLDWYQTGDPPDGSCHKLGFKKYDD